MPSLRDALEARVIDTVACPKCQRPKGFPCLKVSSRRESTGRGVITLKHPHAERTSEYRELIRDQGARWW